MKTPAPVPHFPRLALLAILALAAACSAGKQEAAPAPGAASGDMAYRALAQQILDDWFARNPSAATNLGVHKYDATLDDVSAGAVAAQIAAQKAFRAQLAAIDPAGLGADNALDREQLLRVLDLSVLQSESIQGWRKDPDYYASGITYSAFTLMKRNFAPAEERLKSLIARERAMPAALLEAHKNLRMAVPIYTRIAIEQIDGDAELFRSAVPAAFVGVKDPALLGEFRQTNAAVIKALADYKQYLVKEVLPNAKTDYAWGTDTWRKALAAQEMIELPLDQLLKIAEADMAKNEAAFIATAKLIDPAKTPEQVMAMIEKDHPAPGKLLKTTQDTLDSIRQFIVDHHIITIPPSDPARVEETPPFLRATTSASMDTPGPFETAKLDAYYNMTLPDPKGSHAEQEDFMGQWYYAMISNVSVHEAYPGHYIQFLYAPQYPSDVRKVFYAASNAEGWAHYCEQMMLDEGFHQGEPKYRLAQLQDALLRDVRFVVGIRMHTEGLSVDEAIKLFETRAHQPHAVAVSESKRGTSDALYGYYTLGKLMLLKLRDDYQKKLGPDYTLQKFHDAFIKLGPLPFPLIRKAMLGEEGALL